MWMGWRFGGFGLMKVITCSFRYNLQIIIDKMDKTYINVHNDRL